LGGGETGGGDGKPGDPMSKAFGPGGAILFLKATIPGGAAGDLFATSVHVDGHMRGGRYVAPFTSTRHKKAEVPPVVRERVRLALATLHDAHAAITTARRFDGGLAPGSEHHEAESRTRHSDRLRTAFTTINRFHALAKDKGIDSHAVIGDMGGMPDLQATGRPALTPPEAKPAPVALHHVSPDTKHFYVSAIDGTKRHLVAGPYGSHADALARVDDVQQHAKDDPRTHFMAWGTAGSAELMRTALGADWKPGAAA
jgi:hypothetical protein